MMTVKDIHDLAKLLQEFNDFEFGYAGGTEEFEMYLRRLNCEGLSKLLLSVAETLEERQ